MIQDKYRHKLFTNSNHGSRTCYMPVAPLNTVIQNNKTIKQDIVQIPVGKKSIIYSGSIFDWSGIKQILYQFKTNWNNNFHLVVHYRFPEKDSKLLTTIAHYQKIGYPVTLIIKKFSTQEYHQFLRQFNFGFATYVPYMNNHQCDGKNFDTIGYSSGKFNTLMMLGIPTITTASESFNDLKKKYNYGIIIKEFNEIKNALEQLNLKEDEMALETRRLYKEVLDPSIYIDNYMKNFI